MNNTTYTQLCSNMEQLKLSQMLLHLDEITDFVTVNNLSSQVCHLLITYIIKYFLILQGFPCFFLHLML